MEKGPQSNESYERQNPSNRTISTVLWVHKKLPQSTVKLVLPSNESYESRTGCNRTLPTVLWVPLIRISHRGVAATAPTPDPVAPHPGPPPVALGFALGREGVVLPPARGVAGSLDLQSPVSLEGVEQLHLRVSRYTFDTKEGGELDPWKESSKKGTWA